MLLLKCNFRGGGDICPSTTEGFEVMILGWGETDLEWEGGFPAIPGFEVPGVWLLSIIDLVEADLQVFWLHFCYDTKSQARLGSIHEKRWIDSHSHSLQKIMN